MPENKRFRFGRFARPQDHLPTPQELKEGIEGLNSKYIHRDWVPYVEDEEPLELEQKGTNPSVHELANGTKYCYFVYFTDTVESALIKLDGEEETDLVQTLIEVRVFYFDNGQFAFENNNKLAQMWVPEFIDKATDTENSEAAKFSKLDQEIMGDFYTTNDHVSLVRLGASGDGPRSDGDLTFTARLESMIETVGDQSFKADSQDQSLNEVDEINELAEHLVIKEAHGRMDGGLKHEVRASGPVMLNWSKNEWPYGDEDERRAKIEEKIVPYLERLDDAHGSDTG